MIFITVGSCNKGFNTLLEKCDIIALKSSINFFAQIGSSNYRPKNFPFSNWLKHNEMLEKYKLAEAFIIHGGLGTLSEVLTTNKPILVVPRSVENNEAVNDQKDLCIKLDTLGYVKCLQDLDQLETVVINLTSLRLRHYDLVSNIDQIIEHQIGCFRELLK